MTDTPTFIRTTVTVTVLHLARDPQDRIKVDAMDLTQIARFIEEGDGLGDYKTTLCEEIAPGEVEAICQALGNDGTFFAQEVAELYFPAHLQSEDESQQKWTAKVDQEADALFRTLSEADIRKRQDICRQQAKLAYEQGHDRAALDIARNEEALMREMLRRC
ncbi:hypothetical protein KABACHOK_05810 [Brevundimonas phage vB_BpoS-Kabachok]|uniref:Uncharacterized protein n=1 Tax=Brevundimonas phage vB_BpoS-Kabachok TaxID=2948600 RepID=A0A9E7SKD2_9CAUD|nr:hypothetical protein KABACHOK_05810 [Brevundimonas phage vB_BpoS-Kabachok]